MKFTAPINVWGLLPEQIARLQPGQCVYAGDRQATGRFLGVKPSGTVVVAWQGNVNSQSNKRAYLQALRNFAKGQS